MKKPIIFISHINEEQNIAIRLKEYIESSFLNSATVFVSSHENSLKLGEDWFDTIGKSIKGSKLVISLCSPLSVNRPWINFESGAAWGREIPIIPVCHSGLRPEDLPVPLKLIQGSILSNPNDFNRLFTRIAEVLELTPPKIDNTNILKEIAEFEQSIKHSVLKKDVEFIDSILRHNIEYLKYVIVASTKPHTELEKDYPLPNNYFKNHTFKYSDVHYGLNPVALLSNPIEKIFESFYRNALELIENIKFILSVNRVKIPDELDVMFNFFLVTRGLLDNWFSMIKLLSQQKHDNKSWLKDFIANEPLNPPPKGSNVNSSFIDYYQSLKLYQGLIVNYEQMVDKIINSKDNNK